MTGGWSSRYVQYAKANGMSPENMILSDKALSPGGMMAPYINWIQSKWTEFDAATDKKYLVCAGQHTKEGHAAFDAWLRID